MAFIYKKCGPEVAVCVKRIVPSDHRSVMRSLFRNSASCEEEHLVRTEEKPTFCEKGIKYWCEEDIGGKLNAYCSHLCSEIPNPL